MNGIINVYKPGGMSSHDVIYKVRRALGIKRIGHTGTLDPMACGVLPVCVGKATRAAELIVAADKEYIAKLTFGSETDTQDSTGSVTNTTQNRTDIKTFEDVLKEFEGETEQIPPMYSAVHHGGERLYKLARRGVTVERKSRKITVFSIKLLSFSEDEAEICVRCSKGTYIRTLCEDIGRRAGCMAHMSALERTRSGMFTKENSVPLSEISEEMIIPTDELFQAYERYDLNAEEERKVRNGAKIKNPREEGKRYRLYAENGEFLCISEGITEDGEKFLKSVKNFY